MRELESTGSQSALRLAALRTEAPGCSGEVRISAAKIEEGLLVACARGLDLTYEDRVIASRIRMHDPALDVTEGALDQRHASLTFRIPDAIESVRIFRREPPRYRLLAVDRESSPRSDHPLRADREWTPGDRCRPAQAADRGRRDENALTVIPRRSP